MRRKLDSAGRRQYRKQCLDCGSGVEGWVAQKNVRDIWTVAAWDESLEEAGREAARRDWDLDREAYQREQQEKNEQWWAWYDQYLQSPQWREKRNKALARDGHVCQACLERKAVQVHHKTYDHVGNEPLFDLESVCTECHRKLHPDGRE